VAGNSGPLARETTWERLTADGPRGLPIREYTSVTGRLRRVAEFDPAIVRQAITINQPTKIVLNHLDYVDPTVQDGALTPIAEAFIRDVVDGIGRAIDTVGVGPHPRALHAYVDDAVRI
jgi:adenylosuccinate synthase